MKTKSKVLLLSMFILVYASCSRTETGVIQKKQGSTIFVSMIDDTTMFRALDFAVINARKPQHGMYDQSIIDGKNTYQMLENGDTLEYKNPDGHSVVIVNNLNQIRGINGMKPAKFLQNRTNTR